MSGPHEQEAFRTERRAEASGHEAGIDEATIEQLVHDFYDRVRQDGILAPLFESKISDWGPHLERMCDFWSSVALMSGRYHGQPMQKHALLPMSGAHFDHWLDLFHESAEAICPPKAAAFLLSVPDELRRA